MEFREYMHVEKLGNDEVDGILEGECWIFPKIDGTNASVWLDDGKLQFGSRKRHLQPGEDNAGFLAENQNHAGLFRFLNAFPDLRLFGEWLVPHTLKTYNESAWRKLYVFDVCDASGKYLHYSDYHHHLAACGIEFIPPLRTLKNPKEEHLIRCLEEATFLVQDGKGTGEGIVIKNYTFFNKYGRQTWGKLVTNEFKAKHNRDGAVTFPDGATLMWPGSVCTDFIEEAIVDDFLTSSLVEKVYAKMTLDHPWTSKRIPELLGICYHDLVTEELWAALKKHKSPTVDFKRLNRFTCAKVKEHLPHLF
jgi:hypothetical protein